MALNSRRRARLRSRFSNRSFVNASDLSVPSERGLPYVGLCGECRNQDAKENTK